MQKVRVQWEEWYCTWSHPTGGNFGYYEKKEKAFDSSDMARGFILGIQVNEYVTNIRIIY